MHSSAAAELAAEPGTIASASALRCPVFSRDLANRRRSPSARRRLVQTRPAHRERWQPDRTRERRAADCALTSHDDRVLAPQASAATSRARLAPQTAVRPCAPQPALRQRGLPASLRRRLPRRRDARALRDDRLLRAGGRGGRPWRLATAALRCVVCVAGRRCLCDMVSSMTSAAPMPCAPLSPPRVRRARTPRLGQPSARAAC